MAVDFYQKSRSIVLYNYLAAQSGVWVTQEKILTDLERYYPKQTNASEPHETSARRTLTKDIQAINMSDDFDGIIIHSGKGVKIATREEMSRFIERKTAAYKAGFARLNKIAKKAGQDGQITVDGYEMRRFNDG